tara:strand:+ start:969 stop:1208 length:240 start_codon:yes stop_codon:yes gene_type:complete
MVYNVDDIDKILGFLSWTSREKIDELLRIDASMYSNLGTESNDEEKGHVRDSSILIYLAIEKIDSKMGRDFLRAMEDDS